MDSGSRPLPAGVDTAARLRQLLNVKRDEPAIPMEQLAALRGFPSGSAARQFVMRHRQYIAFGKRGRRVLVTLVDFDRGCAAIERARHMKRSA